MNVNFPPPDYEPPSISSKAPPPPSSRPSLPVRAAKGAAKQTPGAIIGGIIVAVLQYLLSNPPW